MTLRISFKKIIVYLITLAILFEDSIVSVSNISLFNYLDELFIIIYFIFAILIIIKRKGKLSPIEFKILIGTFAFELIGIICCVLFSSSNISSLLMGSFLMIKFYLLLFSVIILPPSDNIKEFFVSCVKLAGVISLVTGVINFILPEVWAKLVRFAYIYLRMGLASAQGLFIHAGQYGWFMAFVGILYLAEYVNTKNKSSWKKFLLYYIIAMLSLKVKVIVSFMLILFTYFFVIEKRKLDLKKILIPAIAFVAVILIFSDLIQRTFLQYLTSNDGDTSARFALLYNSFLIMRDYFPFGVGFGKYASWYARVNYSEYYYKYGMSTIYGLQPSNPKYATDTFWPAVFGETGVLGSIIYIFIMFTVVLRLYKEARYVLDNKQNSFYELFGFFVIIQAFVESMGEPIFNSAPQNIFIAFVLGMSLAKHYIYTENKQLKFEK